MYRSCTFYTALGVVEDFDDFNESQLDLDYPDAELLAVMDQQDNGNSSIRDTYNSSSHPDDSWMDADSDVLGLEALLAEAPPFQPLANLHPPRIDSPQQDGQPWSHTHIPTDTDLMDF